MCFVPLAQNHEDFIIRARTSGLLVPGSRTCVWTVGQSPSSSISEVLSQKPLGCFFSGLRSRPGDGSLLSIACVSIS